MILYLRTDCYGGDGGAMAEMFALTLIVWLESCCCRGNFLSINFIIPQ